MNGILTWTVAYIQHSCSSRFKESIRYCQPLNHEIILRKFERYGFGNKALDLLSNYLTNRTQRCQLNGMLSDQRGITCGIPQGSILGPLLFIIYINDLPNCLKHTTPSPRMFADDTSLTAVGKTLNEAEEIANKDLKNVKVWLSSNKLSLNIAKTEYILIGSRPKINSMDVQLTVKIDTCPIKRVKCAKVLGVEIDENLNWEKQHRGKTSAHASNYENMAGNLNINF